jgi:hypothetical protein
LRTRIERLLANDARQQDDMRVLTAMVLRIDHSIADLLAEQRAIHQWMVGMGDRVRKIEEDLGD